MELPAGSTQAKLVLKPQHTLTRHSPRATVTTRHTSPPASWPSVRSASTTRVTSLAPMPPALSSPTACRLPFHLQAASMVSSASANSTAPTLNLTTSSRTTSLTCRTTRLPLTTTTINLTSPHGWALVLSQILTHATSWAPKPQPSLIGTLRSSQLLSVHPPLVPPCTQPLPPTSHSSPCPQA